MQNFGSQFFIYSFIFVKFTCKQSKYIEIRKFKIEIIPKLNILRTVNDKPNIKKIMNFRRSWSSFGQKNLEFRLFLSVFGSNLKKYICKLNFQSLFFSSEFNFQYSIFYKFWWFWGLFNEKQREIGSQHFVPFFFLVLWKK